jgi:hypothetical protein
MNMMKYLSFTASLFLLLGQLQANPGTEQSDTGAESQLINQGHHKDSGSHKHKSCSTHKHKSCSTHKHKPCSSHKHKPCSSDHHHRDRDVFDPAFLYSSTPLVYDGQDIGTGLPHENVNVNFPQLGDVSTTLPVLQIIPGTFVVETSGHYLINWEVTLANVNLVTADVRISVLLNSISQPPSRVFALNETAIPFSFSGSIILPLFEGDLVQLNVEANLSNVPLSLPVIITNAAIDFVRIAPLPPVLESTLI